MYACYLGLVSQAININLAPLFFVIFHEHFGLSFEMLGRLVLLNFGTQTAVGVVCLRYVDRWGYRASAVCAHLMCFLGITGLGILPLVIPNTMLALALAVFARPLAEAFWRLWSARHGIAAHQGQSRINEPAPFLLLLGQMAVVLVTTLILWVLGKHIWYYVPLFWALIPLYNAVKFTRVPLLTLVPEGQKMTISELFGSRVFLLALLLMVSAAASELTMSQWASLFAEMGLGVPKVVGDLVGPALFAFFMVVVRTAYGLWGDRIDLHKALKASSLLCILCYAWPCFPPLPSCLCWGPPFAG